MKTVRVQVEGTVVTNKILNGFALIPKGQGYEDYDTSTGLGVRHDGIMTVRTYNGTYAKREGNAWVDMTPTRTFTVGSDTVNEYYNVNNNRTYLYSRSTTRVEFVTDGSYIFPWFNMQDNSIIVHTKITPGLWMKTAAGYFYAGRQLFSEPVSVKEWADMVDVTAPPTDPAELASDVYAQVRLPENIYGNIVDFGIGISKILGIRDKVFIYVYGYPNLNGNISEAFDYVASRVSAGKQAQLYFPYVHKDDVLNQKLVTFDGQGSYTYEQEE